MADNTRDLLLDIRDQYGRITPKIVVEVAAESSHPLHRKFNWDDTEAAQLWRERQAAELIRTVRISYTPSPESLAKSVRAFHATVSPQHGHHYAPIEEILDDPVARQLLIRDMQRDWVAMRERYHDLIEFWELVRAEVSEAS